MKLILRVCSHCTVAVLLVVVSNSLYAQSSVETRLPALRVTENGRFLERANGQPFFWMGDTAWRLFANLDSAQVDRYFTHRKRQGFNVIQCSLIHGGIEETNAYGEKAFDSLNIRTPNEAFWRYVDFVVQRAQEHGLYLVILPAWARTYTETSRGDSINKVLAYNTLAAYQYGRFVGDRYQGYSHLVWVLGGDTWGTKDTIYRQLARGLTDGAANGRADNVLMTFHPKGGTYRPPASSSSEFYHTQPWLNFNMIQSGHRVGNRNFDRIREDYERLPTKPTIDAEPCYEHHPVMHKYDSGEFYAYHLRRRGYWSVLAGAFGYTYGGSGVYQMAKPGREGKASHFKDYWYDALDYEGANDMQHLRRLFESRPFVRPARVPDQRIIVDPPDSVDFHLQAARADDYSYWIVYFTNGSKSALDLSVANQRSYRAWWYNPRDGKTYNNRGTESTKPFQKKTASGKQVFDPPGEPNVANDWILVLDESTTAYGVPGRSEE